MANSNSNVVTLNEVQSRLPMPTSAHARGITPAQWRVLVETTFPSAQTAEAIEMAFDYCKVRGLDVFKKPVHIVPMWNSALRRSVETIWPGINEVQITASRTGQWAGMDSPKWGPMITKTFSGERNRQRVEVEVQFPEWCEVTVHRLIGGQPRPFCEPVFWEEAYSTSGGRGSTLPTDMWIKRPRGQLHKVAKAASLRAAFPEEGELTAEEMEGKVIDAGGVVIDHQPTKPADPVIEPPANTDQPEEPDEITAEQIEAFEADTKAKLEAVSTLDALDDLWKSGINAKVREIGSTDKAAMNRIIAAFSQRKNAILKADEVAEAITVLEGTKPPEELSIQELADRDQAEAYEADEVEQPAAPYTPPPPPAAIDVPKNDDGTDDWKGWSTLAWEQLNQAKKGGYGVDWLHAWMTANGDNLTGLRKANPDWEAKIIAHRNKIMGIFERDEEEARKEARAEFPTLEVEYKGDNPDWEGFKRNILAYIRQTPNHLIAREWWTRHALIITNMRKADADAADKIEAALVQFFPQLAQAVQVK